MINFTDTNIQVALISGSFSLLTTIIAAVVAQIISQEILNRKKLKEDLNLAVKDIEFLLEVEAEYGNLLTQYEGSTQKNIIRKTVKQEKNLHFSGKFTPGRAKNMGIMTK
jgi:hypothetical protein